MFCFVVSPVLVRIFWAITMLPSLVNNGALSLAVLSLLTSSVAGEVFEKLSAVPKGEQHRDCFRLILTD